MHLMDIIWLESEVGFALHPGGFPAGVGMVLPPTTYITHAVASVGSPPSGWDLDGWAGCGQYAIFCDLLIRRGFGNYLTCIYWPTPIGRYGLYVLRLLFKT